MSIRTKALLMFQLTPVDKALLGTIPVMFNPNELSDGNRMLINSQSRGSEVNKHFERIEREDFTVKLFFDASEGPIRNVMIRTKLIRLLMEPVLPFVKFKSPPLARFVWGTFIYTGFVTNVREQYTLFSPEGFPIRAYVTVTFTSSLNRLSAAKKSNATASRKFWTVKSGDRLDLIANRIYNDPGGWRPIAEENNIERPLDFPTPADIGRTLFLPEIN